MTEVVTHLNITIVINQKQGGTRMRIGENIKQMRDKKGWTQEELAEKLGIGQTMIGHIERGRKLPSLMLAIDIAKALDCTMNDILCFYHAVKTVCQALML